MTSPIDQRFRQILYYVIIANIAYFFVEFAVAHTIKSVSLFADSIDFLEDFCMNILILIALGWSGKARAKMGMLLSGILLIPTLTGLWSIWEKLTVLSPPEPILLSVTGLGALIVNVSCAYLLVRHKNQKGSLGKAAFFSARNDALANIAVILTGFITIFTSSALPDLIVGIGIIFLNLSASKHIWDMSQKEYTEAK